MCDVKIYNRPVLPSGGSEIHYCKCQNKCFEGRAYLMLKTHIMCEKILVINTRSSAYGPRPNMIAI
jgi:hypothetical protein